MNKDIQDYLKNIHNLSMLEPKNMPYEILESIAMMNEEEFFKTCVQFFVLQNNIPTKDKIVNLSEDEIIQGATNYAQKIINFMKNN